ncbi:MAG: DegT/DnrJ/EryC1/StrS family aminotransferase [Acidobacteria bacterium]|nr:DegT/DnrJ/EryC1/StrS family aminotransferase [Acidobacteriota bacterium]
MPHGLAQFPGGTEESAIPIVNLKLPHEALRDEIEAAMRRVLERQSYILGTEVQELENSLAERHDCPFGIGCASGSDALLLALLALGVSSGDTVLVPAFSFFATAGAVARIGAKPHFVDIDPRTFNMSPSSAEEAIGSLKGTGSAKAFLPVHLYGQCADMGALLALAQRHNAPVVEDAAQAVLARFGERPAGSMGECGCFSFFPTKNLGAYGDGGMILTRDVNLAERLRLLRNHGMVEKHIHSCLGINSRLDTLQAAILLVKLAHLERWTELRREKAAFYRAAFLESELADHKAARPVAERPVLLPYEAPGNYHVYHQFTLRVLRRDELAQHLTARGIGAAVHYPLPLHEQEVFARAGFRGQNCPESERAAQEVLSIPVYPELTEEQQWRVVSEIKRFYFS